jgi:hypothetical protein
MGILDTLAAMFGGRSAGGADDAIQIYVECARCKSAVHVRIDKRHDLSQAEGGGYFVRKEIMDSKCFRLMAAEINLDSAHRVQSQKVQGGRFISREEYEAGAAPATPPTA